MAGLYLIQIVTMSDGGRGPAYIRWHEEQVGPYLEGYSWAMMDYGFSPYGLVLIRDITTEDHDWLVMQDGVFSFPDDLSGPVDQDVQEFFEGIHLPTDWMTPATTWLELLRQVAGMFQFNQRYGGIAAEATGELHSIFDSVTLDDRLEDMTAQEQGWFLAAVASFGYDPELVPLNAKLRQLVKMAGDYWDDQSFYLGGVEF